MGNECAISSDSCSIGGADRRRCSNVSDDAVEDQYAQGREQHDDHHDGVQHDLCGRGPHGLPNAVCLSKTTKAGGGASTL